MKTSRMLVAASCAVLLLNGASAAFAQRGGGGHGRGRRWLPRWGRGWLPWWRDGNESRRGDVDDGSRRRIQRDESEPDDRNPRIWRRAWCSVLPWRRRARRQLSSSAEPLVHGHGFVGPVHFFRPYYAFHPNVSIGFGLWAGYPFAYPSRSTIRTYYPYYPYYYYNLYPPYGSVEFGRRRVKFRRGA